MKHKKYEGEKHIELATYLSFDGALRIKKDPHTDEISLLVDGKEVYTLKLRDDDITPEDDMQDIADRITMFLVECKKHTDIIE